MPIWPADQCDEENVCHSATDFINQADQFHPLEVAIPIPYYTLFSRHFNFTIFAIFGSSLKFPFTLTL